MHKNFKKKKTKAKKWINKDFLALVFYSLFSSGLASRTVTNPVYQFILFLTRLILLSSYSIVNHFLESDYFFIFSLAKKWDSCISQRIKCDNSSMKSALIKQISCIIYFFKTFFLPILAFSKIFILINSTVLSK